MYYWSFTAVKHVPYSKLAEVFGNENEVNLQGVQFPLCGILVRLSRSNFSPKNT